MTAGKPEPLVIRGWTIFAHPLFLAQIDALSRQVETLKQKDPVGYVKKNASKRLAAITKLAFDVIPQDPTRPEYRQGGTLGDDHKHWFRAKFFQQYRLFFRYHAPSKVIVYAWVNDEDTKRAYESSDDAYRVFRKMLESGHPPDDWDQLLAEAQKESQRMQESLAKRTDTPKPPKPQWPERAARENGCHLKPRRACGQTEVMQRMLPKPAATTADTDTARAAN